MSIVGISSKIILTALVLSTFALVNIANAAVILLSESRSVSANASVSTPIGSESTFTSRNSLGDFADFDETVAVDVALENASASSSAGQRSSISTTTITAFGAAASSALITASDPLFFSTASAGANSNLSVNFEVTTPQHFSLSGALSTSSLGSFSSGNANVSLRSQDGAFNISFMTPFGDGETPFDISGTLFPNFYILSANAGMNSNVFFVGIDGGVSDFSMDFNVSAIPLPAAVWLFGSGLLALIGLVRR